MTRHGKAPAISTPTVLRNSSFYVCYRGTILVIELLLLLIVFLLLSLLSFYDPDFLFLLSFIDNDYAGFVYV